MNEILRCISKLGPIYSSSSLLFILEFYFPRIDAYNMDVKSIEWCYYYLKSARNSCSFCLYSQVSYISFFSLIFFCLLFILLKKKRSKGQRKNNNSNNTLKFTNQNRKKAVESNPFEYSGTWDGFDRRCRTAGGPNLYDMKWRQKNGILCADRITHTRILSAL